MVIRRCLFLVFTILMYVSGTGWSQQVPGQLATLERMPEFNEDFEGNTSIWITDNQYLSGKIQNGLYTIKCKNFRDATGLSYVPVEIDQSKDFEIEAFIKVIKGSGGLVFGMDEKYNHYRVEFTDKTELFVAKSTSSIDKMFTGTRNPDVKPGIYNKVVVSKLGNVYYVFINDSFVKEFTNIKLDGNRIGFNVGLNSEITIDNLKVSYLQQKTTPVTASNNISTRTNTTVSDSPGNQSNTSPETVNNEPVITWTSPSAERVQVTEYTARVKAVIESKPRLEKVLFYVNGVGVGESEFQPLAGKTDCYQIDKIINLKPGENSVYFIASYENSPSQKSPVKYFVNPLSSPPTFVWISPLENNTNVGTDNIPVKGSIKSPSGLTSAIILVNGVPQVSENNFSGSPSADGIIEFQRNIFLREGENSIVIIAANNAGSAQSEKRTINYSKSVAEKRLALVVGNSEYKNGTNLKNPANDANLMEATLKDLGFNVIKSVNVNKDSLMNSIREFSRKMSEYNVALFYYAGHGLQVDGVNYLIPTDAMLQTKDDCSWEAVPVTTVTEEFKKHQTNTNIVILDACRNNPYRSWVRGPEQGFKAMGPINGTIISYATSEGATAADGTGANGLFTEELVKQMGIPQQIENVFKNTRKNVMEKSKNQQVPVEWNYLIGDFFFKK